MPNCIFNAPGHYLPPIAKPEGSTGIGNSPSKAPVTWLCG